MPEGEEKQESARQRRTARRFHCTSIAILLIVASVLAVSWWSMSHSHGPRLSVLETEVGFIAQQAPRPDVPVTFDEGCVSAQCHASYRAQEGVHEPVKEQECQECHEPDAGDHTYPLSDTADALCAECHETGNTGGLRHEVLDKEGCLACHNSHVSTAPFLLVKASVAATCEECHPQTEGGSRHDPYAKGECGACHESHESELPGLLRGGEGVEHCRTCHEQDVAMMESAAVSHMGVDGECFACHGAHATEEEGLLTTPLGEQCLSCHEDVRGQAGQGVVHEAVLEGKRCLACHAAHGSDRLMMLRDEQATLCLECHNEPIDAPDGRTIPDMTAIVTGRAFEHGPVRENECTICHSVHGSEYARLLQEPAPAAIVGAYDIRNYALCFSCHDPELVLAERTTVATQFRQGDRNLHQLHIQGDDYGRSCTSCHAVHGSDQPRHMADVVAFQGSDWLMKIGFKLDDQGGSCAPGCHEPLSYSRAGEWKELNNLMGGDP